jgi:phosphoribosylglycinamide formyltransferase-1
MMTKARLVIMASGNGSIAQSIIDAAASKVLDAQVVGLICDKEGAQVLQRAKDAGIQSYLIPMKSDRKLWDSEVINTLEELSPDLVVSAGFMRILSAECVARFRIVNSHPALLPLFPGAHAVRDALAAGAKETGTTIHWVDSGVDTGEIIAQEIVTINGSDTEASLHERIKIAERKLFIATLQSLLADHVRS